MIRILVIGLVILAIVEEKAHGLREFIEDIQPTVNIRGSVRDAPIHPRVLPPLLREEEVTLSHVEKLLIRQGLQQDTNEDANVSGQPDPIPEKLEDGIEPTLYAAVGEENSEERLRKKRQAAYSNLNRVNPESPCPDVFSYDGPKAVEDRWSGSVHLTSDTPLTGIRLVIRLNKRAHLLGSSLGEVSSKDNIEYRIWNARKKLLPSKPITKKIFVRFSEKEVNPPKVRSISLNGKQICSSSGVINRPHVPSTTRAKVSKPISCRLTRHPTESTVSKPVSRPTPTPTRKPGNGGVINRPHVPSTTRAKVSKPISCRLTRHPTETTVSKPVSRPTPTPTRKPGNGGVINRPHVPSTTRAKVSKPISCRLTRHPTETTVSKPVFRPTPTPTRKPGNGVDGEQCGTVEIQPAPFITHGQRSSRGQWPWHAALYRPKGTDLTYICGGTLIGKNSVLTAAHCVTKINSTRPKDPEAFLVVLGKYHLNQWSDGGVQNKQVDSIKVHPEYNSKNFYADIAIIILSSAAEFNFYVKPVCLWDRNRISLKEVEGVNGTVVGWGRDERGNLTEALMMAKMPVVSQNTCIDSDPDFFSRFTSEKTYCAGFRNGTSTCYGDSGGGMVFPRNDGPNGAERWHLRGVVSTGVQGSEITLCNTKYYVIFADVAKYLDWIEQIMSTLLKVM